MTGVESPHDPTGWHATTIVLVRKEGRTALAGDGQVSFGQTVIKNSARKVRRLGKHPVIAGFAGATADAFTLFERLESKIDQHPGQLVRAAVELAKEWRTDRYLRRLEAMMLVADGRTALLLSGTGDVLEPDGEQDRCVMAIGSGGNFALAAGKALLGTDMDATTIARRAMEIAAEICVYTNANVVMETIDAPRHGRNPLMSDFSPRETVSELDRFIIGQGEAKRAVAVALRNRWRRLRLESPMREEVLPKNILMIGPTGCGKTEIARRVARLAGAPFLKVEATRFTEVGYVGRDVEQIIRDLMEVGIAQARERARAAVRAPAAAAAEERLLTALVGANASPATRDSFRRMLRAGELDDKDVELDLAAPAASAPFVELPNMPNGAIGAINLGSIFGGGSQPKRRKLAVRDAREPLEAEEAEKLTDADRVARDAVAAVENTGIVFLDEIDKLCAGPERRGADVSREGVQRDLLPLIEGTTVATKHGTVKTDHILFIASGAFHVAKPSDLLPELQGRLPIRVELKPLTEADLRRILTDTEASLLKQYVALLATESVTVVFTDDAVDALARLAAQINASVENIGARRLHTILERVLEDISFHATDRAGETATVDAPYVEKAIGELAQDVDLSRFIL